jgi:cobalt-zinc-cadmium efflux system membrane fusion protein
MKVNSLSISRSLRVACTVFGIVSLVACGGEAGSHIHSHAGHDKVGDDEQIAYERGPHRGRLLRNGSFELEVSIFETGSPPQFRLYAFSQGKPVPATEFTASIILNRFGNRKDLFSFEPVADYLTSTKEVVEPHSFDVTVSAAYRGASYSWSYPSYEGRTSIALSVAERAGVVVEKTASRPIQSVLESRGKIVPSEHRLAHIIPRFAGIVKEGRKHIGDPVSKGEVLAVIESNQSLQPFEVRSQIAGTIINGHLIVGEYVAENQWVYVVADISEVWAEFSVPVRERERVAVGQRVFMRAADGDAEAEGTIGYISPYSDERTQTQVVRVVVANKDARFIPGMFVTARIVTEEAVVPVAVKRSALQSFRDWQVVFRRDGESYEIQPIETGRSDSEWIEITSGLSVGEEYVSAGPYILKADILKSGASHDH